MEHQHIEEQLTAYLLGDLAPEQAEAMRRHLDECDDCRALAKELEPTLDLLRGALAVDAGVPERLDDERKEEIFSPRHVPVTVIWLTEHRSVLMRVAGVAAVAAVLVALMMPVSQNALHTAKDMSNERRLDRSLEEFETAAQPAAPKPVARSFVDEGAAMESVPTLGNKPDVGRLFKSREDAVQTAGSEPDSFGNVLNQNAGGYVKVEAGSMDDAVEELGNDSSARYQVKKGDTLTAIAAANETTVRELAELNQLPDPNSIQVGGSLAIPVDKPEKQYVWADVSGPQPPTEPAGGAGISGTRWDTAVPAAKGFPRRLEDVEYESLAVADASSLHGLDRETVTEAKHASERRQVELSRGKALSSPAAVADPTELTRSSDGAAYYRLNERMDGYSEKGRIEDEAKSSMVEDSSFESGARRAEPGASTSGPSSIESDFASMTPFAAPVSDVVQLSKVTSSLDSKRVDELTPEQSEAEIGAKKRTVRRKRPVVLSGAQLQDMDSYVASDDMLDAAKNAPVDEEEPFSLLHEEHRADHSAAWLYDVAAKDEVTELGEAQVAQQMEDRGGLALGWSKESGKKSEPSLSSADDMKRLEDLTYAEAATTREREVAQPAQESGGREYAIAPACKPADEVEAEPESELVARAYGVNPFVRAVEQPFSTFAIDVDTAAYTLMRKHVQNGVLPPAEVVRTEEFVNFFDDDYRAPERQTFAVYTELAPTPFGDGRLLKIGVKGKRLGREEQRPAVLTFVIDTSGSMDTPDRLGLVRQSLNLLIDELGEADQVAIVQVDSQARLILPPTVLAERDAIAAAIDGLQCSGSTHLENGIKLGYEVAAQAFTGGSVNRVLLLSDGAANLGSADADQILSMVESHRSQGIFCSVFGFGIGAYNDEILEQLANKGDGSYRFIDSQEEAKRVFVDELAATLHVIASDVKIQVEFYPEQVKTYRQLGYENRQLTKEQFRDDTVDAGEVGSGESVTALYELVAGANTDQPLGVVRVRYRDAATGEVEEIAHPIRMSDAVTSFEAAGPRFRLAAAAAEFAEILRGSPFADGADYADVADALRPVALDLRLDQRVQELLQLVQRAPGLPRASGN